MRRSIGILAFALATPVALVAQDAPQGPAKILRINQETIKPGMNGAHERHESGWPVAFAAAKVPVMYFGMVAQSGAPEAWYVSAHASYAELVKLDDQVAKAPGLTAKLDKLSEGDAQYMNTFRTMIAEYDSSLSIGEAPNYADVRGYRVTRFWLVTGHEGEFTEMAKIFIGAYKKAGLSPRYAMYWVTEGSPASLALLFHPIKSVAEFDGMADESAKVRAQMTAEERERVSKLTAASVARGEDLTLMISPAQSSVPAEFAQRDPEFWGKNPVIAAMNAKKTGVTQAGAPRKKAR